MRSANVEAIKARNPIEHVLAAHGVKLQQRGGRFVGCCPFHEEEHPSLVVYPGTKSFFCFGCRASGDIIDFVRRKERVGFRKALELLGEAPLPPPSGASAAAADARPETHVRAGRLRFLERATEVVIVFDSDEEGQRAARDLADSLGQRARIIPLPAGTKDLAELASRPGGRETFFALLSENAQQALEAGHAS